MEEILETEPGLTLGFPQVSRALKSGAGEGQQPTIAQGEEGRTSMDTARQTISLASEDAPRRMQNRDQLGAV